VNAPEGRPPVQRAARTLAPVSEDGDGIEAAELAGATIAEMDQADAEALADWSYPGIYAFYDYAADPEDRAELLDPDRRAGLYFSVRLPGRGLVGFVQVWPVEADGSVEIGLGLAPALTGRGLGLTFVELLCEWLARRVHLRPMAIVLRVATFNARAITVYERAGFRPEGIEQARSNGATVQFLRMRRVLG
jgi:ribosomal-protein-alanine N-acetyltransferase